VIPSRLRVVLQAIDEYNAQDPSARERDYSERLTGWVQKLQPNPSESLQIAARGQHIGRWTIPRSTYPMTRGGYLRWREDLKKFHANTVADLMEKAGYAPAERDRVSQIILKKNIQGDPDTQTMEDALCLIFLESQFEDLQQKTPDEKMIDIVRKTWRKMSEQGRAVALKMPLPEAHRSLIEAALK
jgi:hypothetical protein